MTTAQPGVRAPVYPRTMQASSSSSLRSALAGAALFLGMLVLGLPPLFSWLMSDPARREWTLSQPGMAGMGGGPNQLWALVGCLLAAALLLGLGRSLQRRR